MTTPIASVHELERYLDAIVELTRHRDPHALAIALLDVLRASIPAARIRLVAISNSKHDTEYHEGNAQTAAIHDMLDADAAPLGSLADHADLIECVRAQAVVSAGAADAPRIVFPVFGAHHVWALLVIDGLRGEQLSQTLLTKLLRVYSNQTFMLSRGQLDPLTGLYNRQTLYERMRRVVLGAPLARRTGDNAEPRGNCFALLDIDYFKQVNDRYGHLYGDEVLLLLARLMMGSFRHEDILFRYGGEEFAAVLINVDLANAESLLDRFRRAVEVYAFPRLEPKTVSIGVTTLKLEGGLDKVVMCADKALYYAKNNGRNQVCCYERLIAEGKLEPVTVAEGDIELF